MFCRYCGGEVPDHSKFCLSCGKQVDQPDLSGNKDTTPLYPVSPTDNQTQPVQLEEMPNSTQRSSEKYSNSSDDLPKQEEEAQPHHIISTGKIIAICAAVMIVLLGITVIVSNAGKGFHNTTGSTTKDPSFYAGNPMAPTEPTETSETNAPVVDAGDEYKIDINSIMEDYEKVVVSSFDADGIAEEYDILGAKQDGNGLVVNISDTEALDVRLDNLILKDTDNSVKQTNSISNTVYNFDTATINYMGNMQSSSITAESYKTINGVPYLLCTIDGVQLLIPFNDITLSAKINPEDITTDTKQNVIDYYEILISTGTEVKLIDSFQWCNIIQMEDGTRLLDVCSRSVNTGEYTRYLTLESNCMFMGITDQIVSGDGITKLGNEGSTIDFNNWGDNFPIGVKRDVIDSYISTDGFIYSYINRGKESDYLLYKIPVDKVAFLNSNQNIPVGSDKIDISQYNSFSKEQKDFTMKRYIGEMPYMFNVDGTSFYNLDGKCNYNAKNIILASGLKTIEDINANYPKIDCPIDFSFSPLGIAVSDMISTNSRKITSYEYVTYKEVIIGDQQFYSIIYYISIKDMNGISSDAHVELLVAKDSVTIKANESSLVLTK